MSNLKSARGQSGKYGQINDMPYGWVSSSPLNKLIYRLWVGPFKRAGNPNKESRLNYYNDVSIDMTIWNPFSTWIEQWLKQQPRYQEFLETYDTIKWSVDKEAIDPTNKVYGVNARLVPLSENSARSNLNIDYEKRNITEGYQRYRKSDKCLAICKANAKAHEKAVIGISVNTNQMLFYYKISDAKKDGFNNVTVVASPKYKKSTCKGYKWFYISVLIKL